MKEKTLEEMRLHDELELPEIDLPLFVLEYLSELKESGRKRTTYVRYAYYIRNYIEWLKESKELEEVTSELYRESASVDYENYYKYLLNEQRQQINSVKRIQSVLGRFAEHLTNEPSRTTIHYIKKKKNEGTLSEDDFVKAMEFRKFTKVMRSKEGLTENQLKGRDYLINRNVSIVTLFYHYGLTVSELIVLDMKKVVLGLNRTIEIDGERERIIQLSKQDALLINAYLDDVPLEVRPQFGTDDPLYAAFDYQRLTYRWEYGEKQNSGKPKALSRLAVQKMILQETRRTDFHINAQKLRNTAILRDLIEEVSSAEEILKRYGLKSIHSFRRYYDFIKTADEKTLQSYSLEI